MLAQSALDEMNLAKAMPGQRGEWLDGSGWWQGHLWSLVQLKLKWKMFGGKFFLYTSSIRYTTVYTISNLDLKSQRHQEKDICVLELGLGTI